MRPRFATACLLAACAALFAPAPAQPASASVERDGDAIVFRGRIEAGSAARFLALLADPSITRLVVTSGGGLVGPALDMAEALHARGLDIEVPVECLSSCANYLLPAARHKRLGWPGAVGWHGTMAHVLYLAQTGQAQWDDGALEAARQLARREDAFYRRIGVDGFVGWVGKVPPYDVDAFYVLDVQDLARFGIRDVTVRAAEAPPGATAPQRIRIDWDTLAAIRPAVALAP